jgi:hypothetical protein
MEEFPYVFNGRAERGQDAAGPPGVRPLRAGPGGPSTSMWPHTAMIHRVID